MLVKTWTPSHAVRRFCAAHMAMSLLGSRSGLTLRRMALTFLVSLLLLFPLCSAFLNRLHDDSGVRWLGDGFDKADERFRRRPEAMHGSGLGSSESYSEVILLVTVGLDSPLFNISHSFKAINGAALRTIFLHPSAAAVAARRDNVFMNVSPEDTVLNPHRHDGQRTQRSGADPSNGAVVDYIEASPGSSATTSHPASCPQFSSCAGGAKIKTCGSAGFMPGDELAVRPSRFRELCVPGVSPGVERFMLESTRVMPSQCPLESLMSLRKQVFPWKDDFLSLPDIKEARKAAAEAASRTEPAGPFEGWAGQLFLLHDMFVDRWGRVFNETHFFHAGRCSDITLQLSFSSSTRVIEMNELVNLMVDSQDRSYTELIEKLPLFLPLRPLLHRKPEVPVLIHRRQHERQWWDAYVGLAMSGPTVARVTDKSLLRVKDLYMPLFQPCGKPSAALWHTLRSKHLLPPQGMPMLARHQAGESHDLQQQLVHPNSSAPLGPRRWLIVLARPPVKTTTTEEFRALTVALRTMERLLKGMFGRKRVVYYDTLPPRETRRLFNRALLLVGCASKLVNTIFMPFVSAVLELRTLSTTSRMPHPLFPSSPFPKRGSTLYRDLAIASGVKHYSLDCSVSASGSVAACGGRERIHVALEGITRDILASHAFSASLLDPTSMGFTDRIPGSLVRTQAEAQAFRAWQQCVTKRGRWVLNLTPRNLPWLASGKRSVCEHEHSEQGGLSGERAELVVARWLKKVAGRGAKGVGKVWQEFFEGMWRVREGLKYVWEAPKECGGWEDLRPDRLCSLATGKEGGEEGKSLNILVIGDSLQGQLISSLVNNLVVGMKRPVNVNESSVEDCDRWLAGTDLSRAKAGFCLNYHISKPCSDGGAVKVRYIRNDLLHISSHDRLFSFLPWNRFRSSIEWADAIVLNRGAHYSMDQAFRAGVRAALRHLRVIAPNKLIIARSTSPGHKNCSAYCQPLDKPQDPESLPFNWGKMKAQNRILKLEVERVGGVFMDIYPMTVLRADSHLGAISTTKSDCLHYCNPGPVDTWSQLLANILIQLLESKSAVIM